jgi:hypothetical protein
VPESKQVKTGIERMAQAAGQECLERGEPVPYGSCPGPEKCAGCYSIGVVDDNERFLHPPKAP